MGPFLAYQSANAESDIFDKHSLGIVNKRLLIIDEAKVVMLLTLNNVPQKPCLLVICELSEGFQYMNMVCFACAK